MQTPAPAHTSDGPRFHEGVLVKSGEGSLEACFWRAPEEFRVCLVS
jgi:hypothetical protein